MRLVIIDNRPWAVGLSWSMMSERSDEHSKMTHPHIFIDSTELQTDNPDSLKNRVPWLASQTDMLAEDWEEAE